MTTEELIEELKKYPGKKVAVVDQCYNHLDDYPCVDIAIDHPGSRPFGAEDWHWADKTYSREMPKGEEMVVIH